MIMWYDDVQWISIMEKRFIFKLFDYLLNHLFVLDEHFQLNKNTSQFHCWEIDILFSVKILNQQFSPTQTTK